MNITKLFRQNLDNFWHVKKPTIAFLGDSVTQGCFEVYYKNDGVPDKYIENAKEVCRKHNIKVCDCYGKWKAMEAAGVEITELLSNKLNHPTREMNKLFAYSLAEAILTD